MHHKIVTVTYRNGVSLEGVALFQSDDTLRILFHNHEDVTAFHKVRGKWQAESGEAVAIEFGSRRHAVPASEEECLCSPDLAAHLMALLYGDSGDEPPHPANSPIRVSA